MDEKVDEEMSARTRLLRALEQIRECITKPDGFIYSCPADFIIEHGIWYEPVAYPPDGYRGLPKHCFGNSLFAGAIHNLKYIEGYALPGFGGADLPVPHAWNADAQNILLDSTWLNEGSAYVEFSLERADSATWDGDASILNDWHRGFPLLKQRWKGEITFPASERLRLLRAGRVKECIQLMEETR